MVQHNEQAPEPTTLFNLNDKRQLYKLRNEAQLSQSLQSLSLYNGKQGPLVPTLHHAGG